MLRNQGPIAAFKKLYINLFQRKIANRQDGTTVQDAIKQWNIKDTILEIGDVYKEMKTATYYNAWNHLLSDLRKNNEELPEEIIDVAPILDIDVNEWVEENNQLTTCADLTTEQIAQKIMSRQEPTAEIPLEEPVDEIPPRTPTWTFSVLQNKADELLDQITRHSFSDINDTLALQHIAQKVRKAENDAKKQTHLSDFFRSV